ncbi:MAG: CRISPR-associated endonuclease Cas2 [Methanosphaera sp.]|nr:CRISPR-associated endonuclease Cas2 [Methanosphaera sp.]
MKMIIITKIKYKKDKEKIKNKLQIFAFREITENTFIGEIKKEEQKILEEKLTKQNNLQDTIIIIPLKPNTYKNITQIGQKIKLEEEKYKII